jgi:DNA-binding protein HU-beta
MTKRDLANRMANKTGLTKVECEAAIIAYHETVVHTLKSDESIFLRGFGTYKPVLRAEKVARNISKDEFITIPAHREFTFKPSKFVKQL